MELREVTRLVLSEFILKLQQDGVGAPTIRSCLGLLQSMLARAVEWDRTRVNVVKLIAKPRVRRARAIKPLCPIDVEALRRQMLRNHKHGLRDATLVSVLAYAGLRPEEALALEYQHVRGRTSWSSRSGSTERSCPARRPPDRPAFRRCSMFCELICMTTNSQAGAPAV